ncbi:myo-inosose-2 dehydratase [Kineosporia sp. NBRC 101731]|uniref:myo-inosose-2 dehydratase n=1 Tax=Kineosporia sp. NBRC 101731 TaxID=3032199 RepID=UPI0024A481F4|nr:myo-inosose-2 dehydratase [Kineosporia sp. NBRC 101731]GLY29224.1 myo-inosose-2 dehydratase [Kineosporia sp. NBRC 101731]
MTVKELTPDRVKLGITPTLWWNDDFPDIDIGIPFGEAVSEMALAGFQGCSIGHKYPTDPAELKSALDLRGLTVSEPWVSTYFTIDGMTEQTVAAFEDRLTFLKAVGGHDIVVAEFGNTSHILPVALFANRARFDDAQWDRLCDGLNRLGRIANEAGMRLCYHHHMGTGVMTRADVDRLLAGTDPALVNLLLDTGHLQFAGDDPLDAVRAHADRIKHVHLKDLRPPIVSRVREENLSFQQGIEDGVFTVPGDGSIDFEPILQALGDAGYEGWLVVEAEQDPAKANPLEYALKARRYLRDVLGW